MNNKLKNMNMNFSVSEPQGFYLENGEGPFLATVIHEDKKLLILKVNESINYTNGIMQYIVASTRHEGTSFQDILKKKRLFVNIVPILTEKDQKGLSVAQIIDYVSHWRGGHMVGNLFIDN